MKKTLIVMALAISLLKITYAQTMDNRVSVNYLHNDVTSDTYNLSVNVWHYVAVTKDNSGNGTIYIDGVSVFSGSWVSNPYSWSDLYIGANYYTGWGYYFKGWIDELRLSNSVRSLSEIQNYYNSSSPFSQDANTLGLWHFDETSGTTFNNTIGGSGTLTGGATFVSGNFGNAVQFDGTSGHGNCGINPPESNWTIEFWFKFDNTNTTGGVMVEPYGMYTTNIALIKVPCTPPSSNITAGTSTTFCIGGSVLLTAVTNAGAGATYQWYLNSNVIGGATNSTYSATASGSYSFSVNNSNGCSATSTVTPVTVNPLPVVTITPSGSTIICGTGSVLLSASINNSYQWKKNNVVITGATNQTYSATVTGSYSVSVSNSCGTTTSNSIQINKYALPTSTISANGATSFCTGGSVTLSSTTNAGVNALYQWYKGATAISGATNSSYIATTASTYKCKVTNSLTGCNRTSAGIVISLANPTASITAGGPLTFCAGGNVLFTAVTNAVAGAVYQWYRNSSGISGASNSTYTATLAGNYVMVVTNSYGCTKASAIKKVIINCRLEEGISQSFYVSPNPCSTCFVNGTMNEQDLIVTDIVGRKINVQFTKSENGFYINLPENDKGIFLIRNSKSGEVVKFVKE